MKGLLFIFAFAINTFASQAQFNDTASLNNYIRDTIKDRRPEKVTAIQIQKAFLGAASFLKPNAATQSALNDTASAIRNLKDVDVFLIAGQSNARGMSGPTGAANSPNPYPGTVYQYYGNTFSEVTNEVGSANTGSAWPSFGITWNNITGRKICFIPTAVNATSQTVLANTGSGTWDTTGTLYSNSITQTNAALAAIRAAGYNPVFKGVLWCQGENDADAINAGTITQAGYISAFQKMVKNYRGVYGWNMPFYIFKIGTRTGTSDIGYSSIRQAQEMVASLDTINTKIVFRGAIDFIERGLMVDVVHYTQTGYNEMGEVGARNILSGNKYNSLLTVASTSELSNISGAYVSKCTWLGQECLSITKTGPQMVLQFLMLQIQALGNCSRYMSFTETA